MERLKQMDMKKALFTIAFVNITVALMLSLFSVWGCVRLCDWLAPQGASMEIGSYQMEIHEMPEPTVQAAALSKGISVMQIILPILIYVIALLATALLFYHLKIREPLEALTIGASHMIDNDLDFKIEAKSQDELGQLCIAFESMRKALLANNRELWRQAEERKRLNAAFSHNLRNPVTVLKGSAKLARNTMASGATAQLAEHLLLIESYTDRIERYVETMSRVQKLEEIPVERESTEWDSLVCRLEHMICFAGMESEKQVRFTAAAGREKILIDTSVLFQIAENLIANALRFAAHRVDVSCSMGDGIFLLSVTDDGCGFPDGMIKNGIQPFHKGREDAEHFGMGLYICELLSGKHGGGIRVNNNQIGATVSVTLGIR